MEKRGNWGFNPSRSQFEGFGEPSYKLNIKVKHRHDIKINVPPIL